MDMVISNGKRNPKQFSSIHLPFAHRANGSLSSASLLTKKQTKVIRFANGRDGLNRLHRLAHLRRRNYAEENNIFKKGQIVLIEQG
jgi:hypothetical protein